MELDSQAIELNDRIKGCSSALFELLSDKGKAIFFPKLGILAQSAEAKGKRINATIGIAVEDDGSPMRLNSIASKISLGPNDVFSYAPSFGKPELRAKWKEMLFRKNPSLVGKIISSPVVTNALTHGLSVSGYLFVNKGDEVIIPDPYWENYGLIFGNGFGGKIKTFDCFKKDSFNIGGLKKVLSKGKDKKVLLLNFPNNPSGYTPSIDEVKQIVQAIKEAAVSGKNIVVLIDDAYFGLFYKDGVYKESIFSQLADLHERVLAVKLDAATKEDYVWGLRVGFMTFAMKGVDVKALEALEAKTGGAVRGEISNASHLSQSLVLNAFSSPTYDSEKLEKYNLLKSRFVEVERVLSSHKEYRKCFVPLPFNSGYFMCVKLKKGLDTEKVRKKLLEKYDTGVINMSGLLRIAFSAVKKDVIPELFDNVYKACLEE